MLDLDETLIHYVENDNYFLIRPNCLEFLQKISQKYEVVLFTAAMQDYANSIVEIIDPEKKAVKQVLWRKYSQIDQDDKVIKDISKLGRDLS